MPNPNSLDQNIYRNLAAQIQSGFYSDGKRFPSAQEIARLFNVSYGPAQRALKALEKEGLIRIGRGKETVVLKKPHDNFLESDTFKNRIASLIDLSQSLRLLSPAINIQGMCHMDLEKELDSPLPENNRIEQWRMQYRLFRDALSALGNLTTLDLYHDINSFIESAFLDIYRMSHIGQENLLLNHLIQDYRKCLENCKNGKLSEAKKGLEALATPFHDTIEQYLESLPVDRNIQQVFSWSPQKGRTRYCDMIAIDLVRKINHGTFPAGTLLPNGAILADLYHVSGITMRRTIAILNKLGIVKTVNGVGTRVVSTENTETSDKLKALVLGNNLRIFLEAYQLLVITCGPIIRLSFPYFPGKQIQAMREAACMQEPNTAVTALTSSLLQAIIRYCPLASIKEIYSKLTLLLLNGSALSYDTPGMDANWLSTSENLQDALDKKDGNRFASIYNRLQHDTFILLKSRLNNIGVAGIDQIAIPVFCE